MGSFWDAPGTSEPAASEYASFVQVGDRTAGTVTELRTQTFDDGREVPQVVLALDTGEQQIVTAGPVRLARALREQRPEVGDHLSVALVGTEPLSGGKVMKLFEVVTRRAGQPEPWEQPTQAAQPRPPEPWDKPAPAAPAAVPGGLDPQVAAALAQLSPEQLAALAQLRKS